MRRDTGPPCRTQSRPCAGFLCNQGGIGYRTIRRQRGVGYYSGIDQIQRVEGFKPLTFQLAGVDTGWNDEDGERVFSAVLEPCDAPGQDEAIGKNQTLCLGVLREMYTNRRANLEQAGNDPESARVTTTEWREGAGLNKQRFYDAKTSLIKLGLIEIQGSTVKVTGNGPVTVGNKRYPGSLVTSGPGGL